MGGGRSMWSSVPPWTCPPPSSPDLSHSHTSKTTLLNVCVQAPREGGESERGETQGLGRRLLLPPLVPGEERQCSAQLCFPQLPHPQLPRPRPSTSVLSLKGDIKARSGGCGWFGEREDEKPTAQIRDPRLSGSLPESCLPLPPCLKVAVKQGAPS